MWIRQNELRLGDLIDLGDGSAAAVIALPRQKREDAGIDWLQLDNGQCVWSPAWFVIERGEES